MVEWRIWYRDGSYFDNTMGPPEAAPKRGVEFIRYRNETHNSLLCQRAEYYLLERDSDDWYELPSIVDLIDWILFELPNIRVVLKGCSMFTPDFEALYAKVMSDPDFLPRAGGLSALESKQPLR